MEQKKQGFNPILPSYEYIPDGEPHVFGDRVYIYGSHDKFNGLSFSLNDYVCWSAPVNDLGNWRFEGVTLRRKQDPDGRPDFLHALYAPDVCQGKDGKYYMYYFVGYVGTISVAVCDTPAGQYQYIGKVKYKDGTVLGKKNEPFQYDPGVFRDDDGKLYLYTGFGPVSYPKLLTGSHKMSKHGPMVFELEDDMLTLKTDFNYIGVKGQEESVGTPYEGHAFFEAASLRKYDGKYYFFYSSYEGHELCYAVSNHPREGFEFGGTVISIGDVGLNGRKKADAVNYLGNTHGSVEKIGDEYFVFYHRQTNRHCFSRQSCADKIEFKDGKFRQAEVTSCGLNGGPLEGTGTYSTHIACNLTSRHGVYFYHTFKKRKGDYPYLTQTGKDRERDPDQYIENFCDGATAGFKYFRDVGEKRISICVKGNAEGIMYVYTDEAKTHCVAMIELSPTNTKKEFSADIKVVEDVVPLYFVFQGKGHFSFHSFKLS